MDFEIKINEKLSLRLRKEEDAEVCFALVEKNREILRKWLPWVDGTKTSDDTKKYLLECREKFAKKENADFGIWYEEQWIGSMGFNDIDLVNNKAEIGYWLDSDFTGKGIMTECVKAIINYGFKELRLHRIQIRCAERNEKSKAIPERLGFTLEGTLRESHKENGEYSNDLTFGLLENEWKRE